MTKADLAEQIYLNGGFSKKECLEVVEELFELIKSTLETGESVKLTGFGTFTVKEKASRRGRNPQTGEAMEITSRKVLTFKPSLLLREGICAK